MSWTRLHSFSPQVLLGAYGVLFTLLALHPFDRAVWVAENLPIVLIAGCLVLLYVRGVRFSNSAYALMSILLFMHTVGGHYTFERVPFAWFNNLFGFERNMYDRLAHFSVGFYAYTIAEYVERTGVIRSRLVFWLFPLFTIAFVAMGYEIIEFLFAVMSDPSAGAAFLGSQGDIWDAQRDMLADTLGAVFALGLYRSVRSQSTTHERSVC